MARLIVKAPYIKSSGGGYLKYIGTRDGVELLPQSEIYMQYINERPRSHGLFGDEESVDLKSAIAEVESYTGNIWTPIISLKREDAVKFGYDNAGAWRNLLRAHRNEIAEAFKISPDNFRWYAAFHDEGDHPHCHMMVWSKNPSEAYLSKKGVEKIKSVLTNDIFSHEMVQVYEQKTKMRDELVREARVELRKLCAEMRSHIYVDRELEAMMSSLVSTLPDHGKMSYGYMPKPVKALVDEFVDRLSEFESVANCYDKWQALQWQIESYYRDKPREDKKLSERKEFRQIKNAVISEALNIRANLPTFEEYEMRDEADEMDGAEYSMQFLWEVLNNDNRTCAERDGFVDSLRLRAERGDSCAQYAMGKLYRDGPLVTPDLREAEYWFRTSAERGNTHAMYALEKLYLDRESWMYDHDLGMRYLTEAADSGHGYAMYRLGKEYLQSGKLDEAEFWFTEAAGCGNQFASYQLGKMYMTENPALAKIYLKKSVNAGNPYAQYLLPRVGENTSPSAMFAATRLLHHLSRVIEQEAPRDATSAPPLIDRKRLKQLMRKRLAMGHKPDDHEEQRNQQTMSM